MLNKLLCDLRRAEIGYKAAINALPYMPAESRPYTQQTADNYLDEIQLIKEQLQDDT